MLVKTPDVQFVDGQNAGDLRMVNQILAYELDTGVSTFSKSCFTSSGSIPLGRLSSKMCPEFLTGRGK